MWREVARLDDIVPGGTKYVRIDDEEVCLCNYEGTVYAIGRRCGHRNAALERGTLEGWIITCPAHFAQFDIRSGKNLSPAIDRHSGAKESPAARVKRSEERRQLADVHDLATFPARVTDEGAIEVEVKE